MISWVADILALQKSSPQKADTKAQIRQSISHPVMIRRTQIVCLLAMIACVPVFAFTETINGITWTYTVNDGEASVCGGIDAPAISISTMGDIFIPSTLGGCPVTTIESNAFSGCCGLTNVSMPDGIASIGEFAFSECGRLNEIVVPNSVTNIGSGCFAGCTNLVSMTLPFIGEQRGNSDLDGRFGCIFGVTASDGLTEVGSRYIPSSLRRVVITDETVVSRSAFDQCAMLTNIELNEGVCDIGQWALAWCNLTNMIIPNSVTNMGMGVFACCGKLESLTLPFVGSRRGNTGTSDSLFGYVLGNNSSYMEGVSIRQYYSSSSYSAFYIPSSLRSVVLTDETELGYGAFYECSGLTNVVISYGVTNIGIYAFRDCCGLTSIAVPDSVTSIGNRAFCGCSGLTSMELPFVGSERGNSGEGGSLFGYIFGIASYGGSVAAIQYCSDDPSSCRTNYVPVSLKSVVITDETVLGHGAFGGCDRLESVILPADMTAIGDAGFSRCSNLMSIMIPSGVTSIRESMFRDCSRLTSIDLPSSVTNLGVNAFYNCRGLTSVRIPNSVVSIGACAFYGCSGLCEVVMPESVVTIGYKAFAGCPVENGINYTGIQNVVAKQRFPWNGLVDITCNVTGIDGGDEYKFSKFIVAAMRPESGITKKLSNIWLVCDGIYSTDLRIRTNGNYRLVWDAQAELGQVRYTNMVVSVNLRRWPEKVQLWANGPYWATTNIGAEEPEEYGYYFWWGDTVGYKYENNVWVASNGYSANFSFDEAGAPTYMKNVAKLKSNGWITGDDVLVPSHDAAHVHWGGKWRMPTAQELKNLESYCDWTWTTRNGVRGYVVRGRGIYASESVFLPCGGKGYDTSLGSIGSNGYYWSSVPSSEFVSESINLGFGSNYHSTGDSKRYCGASVRPVQGFAE